MFRLDYLSCCLTILSTILVGRKLWVGLVIAAVNSAVVCVIGMRTGQFGFVPANLFCIAIYAFSIRSWSRDQAPARPKARVPLHAGRAVIHLVPRRATDTPLESFAGSELRSQYQSK